MSARTHAIVLMIFGAALIRLASGEVLLRYVRPIARLPVLVAAMVVLGLAGVLLVRDRRGPPGSPAAWLLLGPVMAIALISPPALGALTAQRPPVTPPRPGGGFASLSSADPLPIGLSDVVLRTVWHAGDTLRGRDLRVIGFVARPIRGGFVLARLVITCCAADAQPYDIAVSTARPPPATGSWVAVTGRYAGASPTNTLVPALHVATAVPVPQPADPYG